MAKKINISLNDLSSIDKAINELQAYKKELQRKTDLLCKKLAENGVEYARARVATYDAIFTGELLRELYTEKKADSFYLIVSGSKHSAFVEFGTGQLGQEAPYPYELPQGITWEYNTGKTIFHLGDGQYGWFYQRDGQWYFTQGMPSRPYMMETWEHIYTTAVQTAFEVFKN